ncbi:hypothetical protein O7627_34285 [Solwaraspora sp. WMMD1047]|uniref:DUF4286 family protein n=1 Tax=Solwaraspora sp. WMMD1047 TaxID=3016102 RepID=UPI002416AC55|nr:DUF4286 family protein [Solwaraspora sp. WMMD1047]MDG4834338.1 hypothetical protein [Solwaraspora sp. WMMD1047]
MVAVIEVAAAPELVCAEWEAACGSAPGGWAAVDQTHTTLRLDPSDAVAPIGTPVERYLVAEIDVGAAPVTDAPFLYLVRMDVEPAAEDEFNDWYTNDHVANLSRVPGVRSARRYRATNASADVRAYLAVYYLDCPSVRQTAVWQRASHTDWSISIRAHHRRKLATMFVPTGPGFAHGGRRAT